MNNHVFFDRSYCIDLLRQAGVEEPLARAIGDSINDSLRDEVATKSDLKDAVNDLRSEIKDVKSDLRLEISNQTTKIITIVGSIVGLFTVIGHIWK